MIHDLRFMDHALTYWFAAISESKSELTLLEIALSELRLAGRSLALWHLEIGLEEFPYA